MDYNLQISLPAFSAYACLISDRWNLFVHNQLVGPAQWMIGPLAHLSNLSAVQQNKEISAPNSVQISSNKKTVSWQLLYQCSAVWDDENHTFSVEDINRLQESSINFDKVILQPTSILSHIQKSFTSSVNFPFKCTYLDACITCFFIFLFFSFEQLHAYHVIELKQGNKTTEEKRNGNSKTNVLTLFYWITGWVHPTCPYPSSFWRIRRAHPPSFEMDGKETPNRPHHTQLGLGENHQLLFSKYWKLQLRK